MAKLKRVALKLLMSLPPAVLRAMCGGGVVYRGGRTLDPRLQFLAYAAAGRPALWEMPPEEARAALVEAVGLAGLSFEPTATQETATADGPRGPVALTVIRPEIVDPACPPLLFLHGGGGVIGTPAIGLGFASRLARLVRTPVVLCGYRLAPEHKAPAALEDALAAYRWVRDQLSPDGSAAIAGESSGGGLAAAVCQALKRAGEPQPKLQLLIYPWLDLTAEGGSMALYADAFPAPRALMDWAVGHSLPPEAHPADPALSPGLEPELSGLAPAVIVAAGYDPMLDQAETYAKRLIAAGVPVAYRCFEPLSHGFVMLAGAVEPAKTAARAICELTRESLCGGGPEPPLERF